MGTGNAQRWVFPRYRLRTALERHIDLAVQRYVLVPLWARDTKHELGMPISVGSHLTFGDA